MIRRGPAFRPCLGVTSDPPSQGTFGFGSSAPRWAEITVLSDPCPPPHPRDVKTPVTMSEGLIEQVTANSHPFSSEVSGECGPRPLGSQIWGSLLNSLGRKGTGPFLRESPEPNFSLLLLHLSCLPLTPSSSWSWVERDLPLECFCPVFFCEHTHIPWRITAAVPKYNLIKQDTNLPSPAFVSSCLSDDSHSNRCEMISHCCFNLHFPSAS